MTDLLTYLLTNLQGRPHPEEQKNWWDQPRPEKLVDIWDQPRPEKLFSL